MEKLKNNVGAHDCAQRGITLIALVITIIVMLILVAVTITMAINGGLFDYARKAVGETKNALNIEQQLADGRIQIGGVWYNSIDEYLKGPGEITGGGETPGGDEEPAVFKVGDYVNYTPTVGTYTVAGGEYGSGYDTDQTFTTEVDDETTTDVNEALQWRVLSIDEQTGEIELVSATVAQNATPLYLRGADGYNHGVDILNDLCEALYSNENGATARSISAEDIDEKTTYDYTEYINSDYGRKYGDEVSLVTFGTSFRKYPNLYEKENGFIIGGVKQTGGISGSTAINDGVINASGVTEYKTYTGYTNDYDSSTSTVKKDVSVTYTHYAYTTENYLKDLGINTAPKGLINLGSNYWVATRTCSAASSTVYFNVRYIEIDGDQGNLSLFNSYSSMWSQSCGVRPIVSLPIELFDLSSGNGSEENPWGMK